MDEGEKEKVEEEEETEEEEDHAEEDVEALGLRSKQRDTVLDSQPRVADAI